MARTLITLTPEVEYKPVIALEAKKETDKDLQYWHDKFERLRKEANHAGFTANFTVKRLPKNKKK